MKKIKQIGIILLLTFLTIGCSENFDIKRQYNSFNNDLERDNLFGKVKTVDLRKADINSDKLDECILVSKTEYTNFWDISYQEFFDNFGKLQQWTKCEFYKNKKVKTVSENLNLNSKMIETYRLDNKNRYISAKGKYDTVGFSAKFKYDSLDNIIKLVSIQANDTSISFIDYKYDQQEKILKKKQYTKAEDGQNENMIINEYKYDSSGNLITTTSKSEFIGEEKSLYEYDNQSRIRIIKQYQNGLIEKETEFDKYYNPILIKYYSTGNIEKEIKYAYSFDNKRNWIERKAYLKQIFASSNKFIPIYMEQRIITYYE